MKTVLMQNLYQIKRLQWFCKVSCNGTDLCSADSSFCFYRSKATLGRYCLGHPIQIPASRKVTGVRNNNCCDERGRGLESLLYKQIANEIAKCSTNSRRLWVISLWVCCLYTEHCMYPSQYFTPLYWISLVFNSKSELLVGKEGKRNENFSLK